MIEEITSSETIGRGENKKIKGNYEKTYKQKSWEEYVEGVYGVEGDGARKKFQQVTLNDDMDSTITIRGIPNFPEFQRIVTMLKDEYKPGRFAEFMIVDMGSTRFYYLYKSSQLFDIIKIIRMVNDRFYSEYFKQYNLNIGDSILERNVQTKSEFRLHMTSQLKAIIERELKDLNITEEKYGLMCCILTFNKAKEKFEELRTDKFKVYYRDDGYYKLIQEDIEGSARRGIIWLIESLPKIMEDVERNTILVKYYKESNHDSYPELKDDLVYKMQALDKAIITLKDNKVDLPVKTAMDIRAYEDEKELISL